MYDPFQILQLAQKATPFAEELYREFHAHPELSEQEYETAQRIGAALRRLQIPFINVEGSTGIVAIIEGMNPGSTLGIRAEMDALPIHEQTDVPFSSKNSEAMHACGHDFHMANLLAAASVLNEVKYKLRGKVLLIFQPSEELLPGGALRIMQSRAFIENRPELMLGLHVLPELETGKVGFRSGTYMASGDELYFTVRGRGGHGALRQDIIDPVLMASKLVVELHRIPSQGEEQGVPTVLSVGKFQAQGATNVIPNQVELQGTFRTMSEPWRNRAHQLIKEFAERIEREFGGEIEVSIVRGYPSVYNHPELTQKCMTAASRLLGSQRVVELPLRMTTDDFAYYSHSMPSVYFRVGVSGSPLGGGLHSGTFLPNISAFGTSIPLLAWLALELSQ